MRSPAQLQQLPPRPSVSMTHLEIHSTLAERASNLTRKPLPPPLDRHRVGRGLMDSTCQLRLQLRPKLHSMTRLVPRQLPDLQPPVQSHSTMHSGYRRRSQLLKSQLPPLPQRPRVRSLPLTRARHQSRPERTHSRLPRLPSAHHPQLRVGTRRL